jgi:16S rRNA processing protein RimM
MKALPLSRKIFLLRPGGVAYLSSPAGLCPLTVRSIKPIGRHLIISFVGIDDRESAVPYRNSLVKVKRESIPLENGEFFCDDLIGLTVITTDGSVVGEVMDIMETGSNDVYVVKGGDREYLIPAIKDVIREIDPKGGRILIKAMEGMLD